MAITVLKSPTTPNVTGTNLVYSLDSDNNTQYQFRYVIDIYQSGSSTLLNRSYIYPNLEGTCNVDLARTLDDYLDTDYNWKVTGSITPQNTVKTFDIRFGEQYSVSYTGSATTYTGSTPNYLEVFPGVVYKNEGSFNFNTSSFTEPLNNPYLTNAPYAFNNPTTELPLGGYHGLFNSEDYFTATIFGDTFLTASQVRVESRLYVNGQQLSSGVPDIIINLSPPSGSFNTIGFGPKNLAELDSAFSASLAAGTLNFVYTFNDFGGISYFINDKWDGVAVNKLDPDYVAYTGETFKQCSDVYTRFAFINDYGFWDYYNVYAPLKRTTNINRNNYTRPFVRYEDTQALYNINDRGNTQYYTEYVDRYNTTTTWLDSPTAEWLQEMFRSEEVYVQENGQFVPIVITNTSVERNLNTSRNKLFQYTIEFEYANKRISR